MLLRYTLHGVYPEVSKGSELRLRTRFEMTKYPSDHYESCSGQGSQRLAEWIASLHKSLYYPTNVGLVPRTGIDMRTDTVISTYIFFSLRYDTPWDDYSALSVILLFYSLNLFNVSGLFLFEAGTEPRINYLFSNDRRSQPEAHC